MYNINQEDQELQPTDKYVEKNGKGFFNKKTLIALLVVLIAGGAIAANYFYLEKKSPEEVIKEMTIKMQDVKSFRYQVDLEMEGGKGKFIIKDEIKTNFQHLLTASLMMPTNAQSEKIDKTKIKGNIKLEGDLDINDYNNPKFALDFDMNAETKDEPPANMKLGIKIINKIFYLKVDKLDFGSFDLTEITNQWADQWIKIDPEEIKKQLGLEETEEESEEKKSESDLSEEQMKQIEELIKNTDFFIVKESFKDQVINNIETYHYKVTLNKKELKNFIIEIDKIINEKELSKEELDELNEGINELKESEAELWIGKKDYLLYKASINANFFDEKTEEDGSINMILNLSNFNKPVDIIVPQNIVPIEEILEELFKGFFMMPSM